MVNFNEYSLLLRRIKWSGTKYAHMMIIHMSIVVVQISCALAFYSPLFEYLEYEYEESKNQNEDIS